MTDVDWARWVLILVEMLSDLKVLNAYLHGEIERREFCRRTDVDDLATNVSIRM